MIIEMFNNPEIEDKVFGQAFPISKYAQNKWFEQHYNDEDYRFVIETDERPVGIATLTNIDWKNRTAFHGMKITKNNNRGKGIGTDTVMAIMRFAFDELGLNRLDGSWFYENVASKEMYKKCGWKEEGVLRQYVYKHGEYRDLYVTGVLKEDYYELISANNYWE